VDINHYFVRPRFIGGGALSAAGGNLKVNLAAGQVYAYNSNWHNDKANPHILHTPDATPIVFDTLDQQTTVHLSNATDIPVTQWDDNSGTLQNIPHNKAGITLLYHSVVLNKTYSLYPQLVYSSLTEAINQLPNYAITVQVPPVLSAGTIYLGAVIAVSQTLDLANPDEALVKSSEGSMLAGGGQTVEELEGLSDVSLANPRNDEGLIYDGNAAVWRNRPRNDLTGWVNQAGHGFSVGDAIFYTTGTWQLASAASSATLAGAVVAEVLDADNFRYHLYGILTWNSHGLTVGVQYYLANAPGVIETSTGNYKQLMLIPWDSNTVFVNIHRDDTTDRASSIKHLVGQTNHGFTLGEAVSWNGVDYQPAQANDPATLAWGLVSLVLNPNTFEYAQLGALNWPSHGLPLNVNLYLSPAVAGGLTDTEPTTPGQVVQMLAIAPDPNSLMIFDYVSVQL